MEEGDKSDSSNQFGDDGDQKFSRKKTQSQMFWYDIRNLNDSLITEILARLPLKKIFRFKLVCKHWQTLISHPSFRRLRSSILNSNSTSSKSPFRILYRYIFVSNVKDLLTRLQPEIYIPSGFSVLFLPSYAERQMSDPLKVVAISNGLILCSLSLPVVYSICDPLTRKCITLPKSRDKNHLYGEGLITRVNQHHVLTGYKVVRVEIHDSPLSHLNLEMFSSETGEWICYKLPCVIPIQLIKRSSTPVLCYGAFHWLIRNHGMIAFDPYKDPKSVRLIPFPNDGDLELEYYRDGIYRLCDECQGTLRYIEVAHDPAKLYFLTMWAMKDYEKGEWACELKVRRSDLHSSDSELSGLMLNGTFLPLSFDPLNLNVVYLKCVEVGWIVSYDVVNRRVDVACKPIGAVEVLSWRVVIPFVLPRWPTTSFSSCKSLSSFDNLLYMESVVICSQFVPGFGSSCSGSR